MKKNLVLTLSGPDQIGIVEQVTKLVLDHNGNVDSSRMARLGGEFAMLMLIAVPTEKFDDLRESVRALRDQGFKVTTRRTERGQSAKYAGWLPYQVEINGADHEGIIHYIARYLAEQGINIETMDTGMFHAPMSGTPLFSMSAIVVVPPDLFKQDWRADLEDVGNKLNVDVEIAPYTG